MSFVLYTVLKLFTRITNLKKNRIVISDFRDYVLDYTCSGCGRYYKYKSTLKRHKMYECGDKKNFEYGVCGKHKQFAWREHNRSISY